MNVADKIHLALEYHQSGDLKQAENIYREILSEEPNNIYALHYLGILYYQLRKYESAIEYIKKVLAFNPTAADAFYNLGNVYKDSGRLSEATDCFQKSLELDPQNADAYNNQGIIYRDKGQLDDALTYFKKAVQLNPNHVIAYYNLGVIHKDKQQFDEAITCYKRVLDLNPNISTVYFHLGIIFHQKKQVDLAIKYYERSIELNPNFAEGYTNLGRALQENGQLEDAITCYQKAIQLNPNSADSYSNLGAAFQNMGRIDDAIEYYEKAIKLDPNLAETYSNSGNALKEKGKIDDAITYYQKAIQINPNFAAAYTNLGVTLAIKGMLDEAIKNHCISLRLKPDLVEAYSNLGNAYKDRGDLEKAEESYRNALRIKPECQPCYSNLLLLMNYDYKYDAQMIATEHLKFRKQIVETLNFDAMIYENEHILSRRLKIGYVSSDFRRHSVAYFFEPVLCSHDPEQFDVFCYSNVLVQDDITNRIRKNTNQWRNIVGMSDEKISGIILKDKIDILVDLSGHTAGNRILLFARKPAPVQVSWIGYPATTGLLTVDYKIVDSYTDPLGMTEQFYTEKVIRLPECFLSYLPAQDSPQIGSLPSTQSGYITFGSFNNFAKVSSFVLLQWIKILRAMPNSRLIMKAKSFADKTVVDNMFRLFESEGISISRIELLSQVSSFRKHMDIYNRVDIGLDTFPYNGTTTTCEALWMGIPVVTLAGKTHASRVGVSLLSNVGLPDLIAGTSEEYISIAIDLATDMRRLQALRRNLRDMMRYSPLCDARRFTLNLENSYRFMWEEWCNSV